MSRVPTIESETESQDWSVRLAQLRQRLHRLRLDAGRVGLDGGTVRAAVHGSGLEFHDARPYRDGDDVRSIDWRITARTREPYVRRYEQERDLRLTLVLDASGSMGFGTQELDGRRWTKWQAAIDAAALFALLTERTGGRVHWLSTVPDRLPPHASVGEAVGRLAEHVPHGPDALGQLLTTLARRRSRRSLVVVLTDHHFDLSRTASQAIGLLNRRHQVRLVRVFDPAEQSLPQRGLIRAIDPETGQRRLLDAASSRARREWADTFAAKRTHNRRDLDRLRIASTELSTADDPVTRLGRWLRVSQRSQ